MKVYVVYWSNFDGWDIDKVFDDEQKAKDFIEYRLQMTGLHLNYFEKTVE